MAFIDLRMPEDISFGATGGPGYQTDVVSLASGYEQRNSRWNNSRRRYDVGYVRSQQEIDALTAFFHACKGRANTFRFKDWADYACDEVQGVMTPLAEDGTTWQLVKTYDSFNNLTFRDITLPVSGTIDVYEDDVLLTSGYEIDYDTGVITFDVGRTESTDLNWSGEFDVPCRFDTDELMATVLESGPDGRIYQLNSVPIIEVKV